MHQANAKLGRRSREARSSQQKGGTYLHLLAPTSSSADDFLTPDN